MAVVKHLTAQEPLAVPVLVLLDKVMQVVLVPVIMEEVVVEAQVQQAHQTLEAQPAA